MAKRGAPRTRTPKTFTKATLAEIDRMAEAQCKDTTIAERLGVNVDTFRAEFQQRTRQKRAEGKAKVLLAQYQGCLRQGKGAMTERIWWGKQHLEQSDKQQIEQREPFRLILSNGHESTKKADNAGDTDRN